MLSQIEELLNSYNVMSILNDEDSFFIKRRIDEDEALFYMNIFSPIHPNVNGVRMDYVSIYTKESLSYVDVNVKCQDTMFIKYLEKKYIGATNSKNSLNTSFKIKEVKEIEEFIQKDISYLLDVILE